MIEGALQFESAAADVLEIIAEQSDNALRGNLRAGFLNFLIVDQHLACENESLGPFARCGQGAVHEKFVESNFQETFARELYHESASTCSSAKC